jgi:hypothetical protein
MVVTPPRWGRGFLRTSIATLVVAAMAGVPSAAHADDATAEDVYTALGLYEAETHYVVLVDTSASMETNNLYGRVRDGLTRFVKAVGESDTVTIMAFAEQPSDPCFSGTVNQPEETLTCLPRKATGTATDIGLALDAAMKDIKATAAPVSVVLLISDGDQQAPDTSPYGAPSLKSAQWAALRKRADALPNVYAYALQLGASKSAKTLGVVFKNTQTLNATNEAQMRKGLAPPREDVLHKAVRAALTPDLAKPVKLSWSAQATDINAADGSAQLLLTIESQTENIPLSLTQVSLRQVDGTALTLGPLPTTIDLQPGSPYTLIASVSWRVPSWPRLSDHEVDVRSRLELSMTVSSPWDTVIKEQGLKRSTVVEGSREVTISGTGVARRSIEVFIGVPIILIGLIVGVLLLIRRRGRGGQTPPPTQFAGVIYQRAIN